MGSIGVVLKERERTGGTGLVWDEGRVSIQEKKGIKLTFLRAPISRDWNTAERAIQTMKTTVQVLGERAMKEKRSFESPSKVKRELGSRFNTMKRELTSEQCCSQSS